ncbi:MAG: sigma-54-dependent Fis family transcriptional regulator [Armatimonadetes bacterium]|nr:sigma-54-dependent Fis family transcriptional regulator [Armatimonadota bacterium]
MSDNNGTGTVLIADDEANIRKVLDAVLSKEGYAVLTAENGKKALDTLSTSTGIDVLISDLIMPDINGVELLEAARQINPSISVIMITAHGTIKTAVDAMRLGAFDYITKPFDMDEIKIVVQKALERRHLINENIDLRQQLKTRYRFENIVGTSSGMQEVFRLVERVADSRASVLVRGESGTGKELIARALHYNSSRGQNPFVPVACVALSEQLLESELFGHEKGSFTGAVGQKPGRFEMAHTGTLFLDEIGDIPGNVQMKLLRVIQEREFERVGGLKTIKVDVRLVTATNQDLEKAVKESKFREDLYYRLQVVQIHLPPLRDRRDDIPLLVEHFIEKYNNENGKSLKYASPEALELMINYRWPGNVRELENVIERAVVLAEPNAQLITPDLLPLSLHPKTDAAKST